MINRNHATFILITYLFWYSLNTYEFLFNGSSWCYDLIGRVNINESFINLFHFYWTSFTYLPTFFFWNLLLHFAYHFNTCLVIMTKLFILYNTEVTDFLAMNYTSTSLHPNYSSLNLLLINNLNKYHPYIYYMSVISLITIVVKLNFTQLSTNQPFKPSYYLHSFYNQVYTVAVINVIALFLGSWWALQEGTWGGWWNWDPSEVFGLLTTLFSLLFIHQTITYLDLSKVVFKANTKLLLIFFFYFFIQLNFDIVSHNFGTKFFFFFSNNLYFLEVLLILFYATINIVVFYSKVYSQALIFSLPPHSTSTNYYYLIVYAYVGVIYLLSLSFLPLLNYCLWNYFFVNSFNILGSYEVIIGLTLVSLVLFYKRVGCNLYLLTLSLVIPFVSTWYYALLFSPMRLGSFLLQTHLYLIYFISINIISNTYSFIYWANSLDTFKEVINSILLSRESFIYVCDNYFTERHQLFYSHEKQPLISSTIFYRNTAPSLHSFFLSYNNYAFANLYNLSSNYINISIIVETNLLNNLYNITISYGLVVLLKYLLFYSVRIHS